MRSAWLMAAFALAACHDAAPPEQHDEAGKLAPINAEFSPPPPVTALPTPAGGAALPSPAATPSGPHFVATGTEPFWSADVAAGSLRYKTPDNPAGDAVTVAEAKDGPGMRYSGTLRGQPLDLLIVPGKCSDGMSDKDYAYSARLLLGTASLRGCAERK